MVQPYSSTDMHTAWKKKTTLMHENIICFFSFLFITKYWSEGESGGTAKVFTRKRRGICNEPLLLRYDFTSLVHGQLKNLIISASMFSTLGPSKGIHLHFLVGGDHTMLSTK